MILKVALVDDEQIILNGLQSVIDWKSFGCEVVGTAADGRSGLDLVRNMKPDILLTDIRMPNMDGIAMIAALKSEFPRLQVSILTAYRDFEYARKAIGLGVSRYLLKPSKMDDLEEAILYMSDILRTDMPIDANDEPQKEKETGAADPSAFIVERALQYMKENCVRRIRLSDVADSVYVSQWHLSKLLNRYTGRSFFDILSDYRINKSKEMITDPSLRIHEIAVMVGFSDVAHFSKTFKRLTGKSPVDYRASYCR